MSPINWTAVGGWAGWAGFFVLLGVITRQIGPWRKLSIDAEQVFRDGLMARITVLEEKVESERERYDARVGKLEAELEREREEREAERLRREREIRYERHKVRNLQACFDGMMLLLKANPENAAEAVIHIEKMRADQLKAEAIEATGLDQGARQ